MAPKTQVTNSWVHGPSGKFKKEHPKPSTLNNPNQTLNPEPGGEGTKAENAAPSGLPAQVRLQQKASKRVSLEQTSKYFGTRVRPPKQHSKATQRNSLECNTWIGRAGRPKEITSLGLRPTWVGRAEHPKRRLLDYPRSPGPRPTWVGLARHPKEVT